MNLRGLLRTASLAVARRAARSYVAGADLAAAVGACRALGERGVATTLCFWNGEGDRPRRIADEYMSAIDSLAAGGLKTYLSMKAPPLGFDRGLAAEIVQRARQADLAIHFDSLAPEAAGATFRLIRELRPRYAAIGCTLPGRWKRSWHDAEVAIELGLPVRVVKGQWADPEGAVIEPRLGFLRVIDQLEGRCSHVRVATHDPALARTALDRLRKAGTSCELELLFGLPYRHMISVAHAARVPIRVYVPYGHAWLPYALGQARRNPKIVAWVLRDLVAGTWTRPPLAEAQ